MSDAKSLFNELKTFLEEADVSRAASHPLKHGAQIGIKFIGFPDEFHVVKDGKRLAVKEGAAPKPDWKAEISPAVVTAFKAMPTMDIGDLGVEVLKRMAKGVKDPHSEDAIRVHLTAGFFTILRHGYLGILPLGGPKVARYLSEHNLVNPMNIRRVFKKVRGNED